MCMYTHTQIYTHVYTHTHTDIHTRTYAASQVHRGTEPTCQCRRPGDSSSIARLGRCPEGGHDDPLQHPRLENPADRGARWAAAHRGHQEAGLGGGCVRAHLPRLQQGVLSECVVPTLTDLSAFPPLSIMNVSKYRR